MDSKPRPHIVLIHGAANSSVVWRFWQEQLATLGWRTRAVDLRGHGAGPAADLSAVSMENYADDVALLANQFASRPVLIGWSMGGLVALMVAARGLARACLALAPSIPTLQLDENVPLRSGVFDARHRRRRQGFASSPTPGSVDVVPRPDAV
jgi:pimeloyl-ACP methyl ester carboxylesterase